MAVSKRVIITIDGTTIYNNTPSNFLCGVIENGLEYGTPGNESVWNYSGSGTFLGFADSAGATTAQYENGYSFYEGGAVTQNITLNLYSVASSEPTGNEYTLTQTLTNLTSGNITLVIEADEGYSLPAQADIVVTGGSIVSYDDTTGELVVTAGTTAVEVTCESAVSTIRFTIDGTTYQAEENMTWAQWVDSAYNTGTFRANGMFIKKSRTEYVYNSGTNVAVESTQEIVQNHAYILGPNPVG